MCMFVYCDSCKCCSSCSWIIMEGSSDSIWQRSNSSRRLNSLSISDRNRNRIDRTINGNTSHDSVRKGSERICVPDINNHRTQSEVSSDVSLRQWLDNPERTVEARKCVHVFSQIVDIVKVAHFQGIVVHNVRPSCFVMSSLNRVSFIESASCSDSSSDSLERHGSSNQTSEFAKFIGSASSLNRDAEINAASDDERVGDKKHSFPMKRILLMESNWYSSPEVILGGSSSFDSDIYQLGVLLFELFCTFGSFEEKSTTMASLRHRVLPPQLLLKWPKEASFCLWLLHPEPSSRPKMSDLLQSDFLNEPRDDIEEREAAIELKENIEEQELLLEFLLMLQQRKKDAEDTYNRIISFMSSDIEEVTKLQKALCVKNGSSYSTNDDDSGSSGSRKRIRRDSYLTERKDESDEFISKSSRLMKNFQKLESSYFLTRQRSTRPTCQPLIRHSPVSSNGRRSLSATERSSISNPISKEQYNSKSNENKQSGWISTFVEGISKYLCFSKLKVKAELKQGDLLNSSNLVCALSFDRDGEFFATAGVNKKIKVFEYNSILNLRDIHYPVVEMSSKSKLSSICWNGYIKSQIASSNFEGVVQVWDVTRSEIFMEMREHERRVWSVDFSLADPTMLVSGSDDGSVKLWNINQGKSVGTIKTKANVCCVQFPTDSGRFLAFGSADHKIYYYDLRNAKIPLCTLVGHYKTVSYVKFIDSTTLVSASTDNTIKLWDLSTCTSRVLDCPLQSFTGHLNVKNFVGLSVSDGYIATGSETNEVVVYHKSLPMPAVSYKFNDPLSGNEVEDTTQFISSVCWRGKTSTLVAANSLGNIKLLEMV